MCRKHVEEGEDVWERNGLSKGVKVEVTYCKTGRPNV